MSATKEQVRAGVQIVGAIAEAIRTLGRVPSGHLYCRVMGRIGIDEYSQVIGILVRAGLVEKTASQELVWVGPQLASV